MSRLTNYRESILSLGYDFTKARILQTAFELDIFERLKDGPKTARTLAEELKSNFESLEVFLNALVSLGLLTAAGSSYVHTKYGREVLIKGEPLFIGDIVALQTRSAHDWLRLKECVLTGKPVDEPDFFKAASSEATASFARAMQNTAMGHADHLARKFLLPGVKTLLDLGGGPGTFTIHFLKENPELKATIFDLPATFKTTRKFIEASNLTDRVEYQEGDFNTDDIEGSFDVCFLSHIIHGQGEEMNRKLFKKIFTHLNTGGRLIVQDFFLNADKCSPQFPAVFALHMLIHTEHGQTYTFDEVQFWMRDAGFRDPTRSGLNLPRSISLLIGKK